MTRYSIDGELKTAYSISGEGVPLLLLHGTGADRHMFDDIEPLLAKHFTVISYDQRDCGETENAAPAATLSQLADDAKALLRDLGFERAHVFGSSFGGRLAQAFAALHGGMVARLILGSTWPLPHSFASLNPVGARLLMKLRAGLPGTAHKLARLFFPNEFLTEKPDLLDFFNSARTSPERNTRRAETVSTSADVRLCDITARTLLLVGSVDRVVPPQITLNMATEIIHCQQVVLEGVGHANCLQAPREVAEAIIPFLLEDAFGVEHFHDS